MFLTLIFAILFIVVLVILFALATHYFLLGMKHDLAGGHIQDDSLGTYELISEDDYA